MSLNIRIGSAERAATVLDYRLNIAENTASGIKQLRAGNQPRFAGWSGNIVESFLQVSLEAVPATHYDFWRRVAKPLQDISADLGLKGLSIPAIFAGEEDLPPHITFTRADFRKSPGSELSRVVGELGMDVYMRQLRAVLVGSELAMDTFVAGNASYICTSDPSDLILGTRKAINQLVETKASPASNMQIVEYKLAQVSSARITDATDPAAGEAFAYEAYEKVGRHLITDPLLFRVQSVFFGSAADHIKSHRPELLLVA